jgi:hypothetical protein
MNPSATRRVDRVYHLVDPANWASIQRHGLLSMAALLDRCGIAGAERARLLRRHRPTELTLPDGSVIRDQKPMPPTALTRCLQGMQPDDWYALLNSKVFFWLDPDRLNRQRRAGGVQSPALVMTVDAERLLRHYAPEAAVTPFNTGNARRQPARRGHASFVPYAAWQESAWASESRLRGKTPRPASHAPVELAIADAVPDVMRFVVETRELPPGVLFTA